MGIVRLRVEGRLSAFRLTVVGLLLAAAGIPIQAATSPVGAIPGSHQVTPSGAFIYTIPIAVPPGTAGMQPNLSLAYNSQGGNGLLGMGWSLSGLSVIHRCPKTIAQDGTKGGINLDANDRYCIDGQRLVAISGGYGGANTEYRTETESYSRIVSYSTQGGGPSYWKVWSKSGQVMEYGVANDSRIEAQGKTEVLLWALNKVLDSVGNHLAVTYTEDNANGQYYPTRIDYTGNANTGKVPTNSVLFKYEARPDSFPTYVAGALSKNVQRLSIIQAYKGNELTREYRLAYGIGNATQRSRLETLTTCSRDAVCLPSTRFSWSDFTPGLNPSSVWATASNTNDMSQFSVGDVNGDGKSDVLHLEPSAAISVSLSNGSGFSPTATWANWWGYFSNGDLAIHLFLGEMNGDGKADAVLLSPYKVAYFGQYLGTYAIGLSNGNGFMTPAAIQNGYDYKNMTPYCRIVDLDGDGRTDIISYDGYNWFAFWYKGGNMPVAPGGYWGNTQGASSLVKISFADVNGDGFPDFVQQTDDNKFLVGLGGDRGFAPAALWGQQQGGFVVGQAQFADVNGDGKADLVFQDSSNAIWVSLSTGTSLLAYTKWIQLPGSFVAGQVQYVDLNGDGLDDLFYRDNANQISVALSNGNGFLPLSVWGQGNGAYVEGQAKFGDLNGDGFADLVFIDATNSQIGVSLAKGTKPDVLTSITNGLNANTSISFKPLTDNGIYSKSNDAIYPYQDVKAAIYVVSNVSTSDGVGGSYATDYSYAGAKIHVQGGGFLGFRQVTAHDPQAGIRTTTTYRQDYPYHGLPLSVQKVTDSLVPLNQVNNTYSDLLINVALSPTYHRALLAQSVESSYELTGGLVTTVTTQTQYDAWGNPTQIVVSTGDGYSKTTSNAYDNLIDGNRWYLGRLRRSSVTSVTP